LKLNTTIQRTSTGEVINLQSSTTKVQVFSFGAILNEFSIETPQGWHNVIDGFTNIENAVQEITNGFKSARLAPFVCRLKKGNYSWNQQNYHIDKFMLGQHAIHGLVFNSKYEIQDIGHNKTKAWVNLIQHFNGCEGYPFAFSSQITYTLEENNQLVISTKVTNRHTEPIPFTEGWHPYFKLDVPINECCLQIASSQMLSFNNELIPTGAIETDIRFTNSSVIEDTFLDNCFILESNNAFCLLTGKHIQLQILPVAGFPYLQVYTPNHRNSIAIENLSGAPDCFNNHMGLLALEPGIEYEFSTIYQLQNI
jgi:aldose 1-epimerase